MSPTTDGGCTPLIISEVQLLLAEKNTSLAVMRTGIAVFALPLSVFSVLIATSKQYSLSQVEPWLVVVLVVNTGLIALGTHLVVRSLRRVHAVDERVESLKKQYREMADLVV